MRFFLLVLLISSAVVYGKSSQFMESGKFLIEVDTNSGALLSIKYRYRNNDMSWISGPDNTIWQPSGSRWGLGYAPLGNLNRAYWNKPNISIESDTMTATYKIDVLKIEVTRNLTPEEVFSFDECYTFTNTGNEELDLKKSGRSEVLGIYTPFNDHYTNTTDALNHRVHAHIWANGGSSWVQLLQMGLQEPYVGLGLVLTEGALEGYSVESRNTVTSSNTRGFFVLHPHIGTLSSKESKKVCWTMFWNEGWDDFCEQIKWRSSQALCVNASSFTAVEGEEINLTLSGAPVTSISIRGGGSLAARKNMAVDPKGAYKQKIERSSQFVHMDTSSLSPIKINSAKSPVSGPLGYNDALSTQEDTGVYPIQFWSDTIGEQILTLTTGEGADQRNSTIVLNIMANPDETIRNRIKFIVANQQVDQFSDPPDIAGAYAVYDNQMNAIVTFDTDPDKNTARERVGMGVLISQWLQSNSDEEVERSLWIYYDYVINKLQTRGGSVLDSPLGRSYRLYNWPWVMQLHLNMAKLKNEPVISHGNFSATPLERFMLTVKGFYKKEGHKLYAIGLPVYEGLSFVKSTQPTLLQTLLNCFKEHGKYIADKGDNYPAHEVNYEQSIVAPAANILLELYRFTEEEKWLESARRHFNLLEAFSGRQPHFRLHDIAIRHWDGYWFGKDRMWGDIFPHYWSTLTALAMHHYSKATSDESYGVRAKEILKANMGALFTDDGRGSCAFIYPVTVDGRKGHYNDPYSNDQDWALAHWLQIMADQ